MKLPKYENWTTATSARVLKRIDFQAILLSWRKRSKKEQQVGLTLQEFVASSLRNVHLERYGFVTLYMRKGPRYVHFKDGSHSIIANCLQLASVEIEEELRGTGLFSQLLHELKTFNLPIYVENVLNPHLEQILDAKGFMRVDLIYKVPCFLKIAN